MKIDKTISQIGASLIICLAGKEVGPEFNRLLNFGMVQMKKEAGESMQSEWVPQIESGSPEGNCVAFKSNLTKFNRAIDSLSHAAARATYTKNKMKRGFKKLFQMEREKLIASFRKDGAIRWSDSGLRTASVGGHGRAGEWGE